MEIFSRYIVRYHGKDLHLLTLISETARYAHLAYGHLTYRRLLSFTPKPLIVSAHAPPIKGFGADCDSRH